MRAKVAKKKIAKPRRKPKPRRVVTRKIAAKKPAARKKAAPRKKPVVAKKPAPKKVVRRKVAPKKTRSAPKRAARVLHAIVDRTAHAELEAELRRLRSARRRLEHQLTEAVQEIGMLRQFELRAQMLDAELAKRDQEISRLRAELDSRLGGASIVSASTN